MGECTGNRNKDSHATSQTFKICTCTLEIQKGKDIHICPVQALYNYMSIRGGKAGPLFLNEQKCQVSAVHFTATLQNCVKVIS